MANQDPYGYGSEPQPPTSGSGAYPPPGGGGGYPPQGPPGYGGAQPSGYGAAQQPGYGAPQEPGYGAPQDPGFGYGGPPAPPPKKSRRGLWITLIVVALLALACCGVAAYFLVKKGSESAANAKAGDCLAGPAVDSSGQVDKSVDLKVVACTDSTVRYKVLGRVDHVSQSETLSTNSTVCDPYKDTTVAIWLGTSSTANGTALCLGNK